MSAFLSSFASYLIKMIILVAIGMLGGFIGIKLRKNKDSKAEVVAETAEVSDTQ